jgi:hypothetical protein
VLRSFTLKIPLFSTPGLTEHFDESVIIANGLPAALKALERVADSGVEVPQDVSLAVQLCAGSHGAQTLVIIGDSAQSTSVSLRFHPGSVQPKTKNILESTGFVRIFEAGDPVEEWVWLP